MEILRSFNQISDKVQVIFNIDASNLPILDPMSKMELTTLLDGKKVNLNAQNEVSNLAELIFQLNEYMPALCNFVKMFLITKYYDGIIVFMEKLFVAHVGSSWYTSKNKEYSHKERFFDRFVEVIKSTDVSLSDVLPFLFNIVEDNDKTILSNWLAPCLEYMQNIFRENMEDVKAYVANAPSHKLTYLELGLEFNTQKTIKEIFDSQDDMSEKIIAKILKHYYTDTMAFFDKNLETSGENKFRYVKILASIENPEVTARLEDLYEEEQDDKIRAFIKSKLGISDKQNLGCSPKHFETMARKKVELPQERTLGVPFEKMPLSFVDGTIADNIVKTYLLMVFKEEKDLLNLKGFEDIKALFDSAELDNFVESIFNALKKMKDIKEAKWAIRMISLIANESLEEQVFDFIQELYKCGRAKEGKYFIECLIYCKRQKAIMLISKLMDDGDQRFVADKDYFVSIYSDNMEKTNSDVLDMLASDEVTNEALEAQKNRLYSNFIAGKSYTKDQFNAMFISKKVFNTLAQNLVFGEYKFDRLCSLFVLEGQNIKYISGTTAVLDKDVKIKIAHSLDLDERFESVKQYFQNPAFVQFENSTFAVKESEKTLVKVASQHGILINALKFTGNMANFGFVKNVINQDVPATELVHICPELNLLAEVAFETPITYYSATSSIGNIRFYKLNQCLKNGNAYIINKANAIAIGGVEPRYYDYVLNAVSKSKRLG